MKTGSLISTNSLSSASFKPTELEMAVFKKKIDICSALLILYLFLCIVLAIATIRMVILSSLYNRKTFESLCFMCRVSFCSSFFYIFPSIIALVFPNPRIYFGIGGISNITTGITSLSIIGLTTALISVFPVLILIFHMAWLSHKYGLGKFKSLVCAFIIAIMYFTVNFLMGPATLYGGLLSKAEIFQKNCIIIDLLCTVIWHILQIYVLGTYDSLCGGIKRLSKCNFQKMDRDNSLGDGLNLP